MVDLGNWSHSVCTTDGKERLLFTSSDDTTYDITATGNISLLTGITSVPLAGVPNDEAAIPTAIQGASLGAGTVYTVPYATIADRYLLI